MSKAIKNKHHQQFLKLFRSKKNIQPNNNWVKKYLGTTKTLYQLSTAPKVKLVKSYLRSVNIIFKDFSDLLLSLANGSSFEELSAMGIVLANYPTFRQQLPTGVVNKLFDHVEGWAETDIACCFSADDLINNWLQWQKLLTSLNIDKNIHKRRASLVLLTQPLRHSPDSRFYKLTLKSVDKLKSEKDILITKAISWVLRSMIKFHPDVVKEYIEKNKDSLPKIAVREVTSKLLTGKKYVNIKKQNAHKD